ncbi:MAG: hypothetical protein ABGY42_12350, partial [bacterium]
TGLETAQGLLGVRRILLVRLVLFGFFGFFGFKLFGIGQAKPNQIFGRSDLWTLGQVLLGPVFALLSHALFLVLALADPREFFLPFLECEP